jgi:hypothetical protein
VKDNTEKITLKQLFDQGFDIRIPMIQRHYAQGRRGPSEEQVRELFLRALWTALIVPPDDAGAQLNLDFIYGSVASHEAGSFEPLDGQQRLTTLMLLHWYLAWQDRRLAEFQQIFCTRGKARFSYSVRPSSGDFFDAFLLFVPDVQPSDVESVTAIITDQPWYFRRWRLDPSIQSCLVMLDAIHLKFKSTSGLFSRLIDAGRPAITFQVLKLEDFRLSDDLYIKMNARGKPLTAFEKFKARYEEVLAAQFGGDYRAIGDVKLRVSDFVARQLDTQWSDLMWGYRDPETANTDDAMMNVISLLVLLSRDCEEDDYWDYLTVFRSGEDLLSDPELSSGVWLDEAFTQIFIDLMEAWSAKTSDGLTRQLPDSKYFDEDGMFKALTVDRTDLTYADIVRWAAYVWFIREHENSWNPARFQDWMRVILNLTANTEYNYSGDLQRSIAEVRKLLVHADSILEYLASPDATVSGFNRVQVSEERAKAKLLIGHEGWRELIGRAEDHGYFRGQIGFLVIFSGFNEAVRSRPVVADWAPDLHESLQSEFRKRLDQAEIMFDEAGLQDLGEYRWERALLCMGNYLISNGRNHLFPVSSSSGVVSWKRLLSSNLREVVKKLWDRLRLGEDIPDQLDAIIREVHNLDRWREVLASSPAAVKYCTQRAVRFHTDDQVYLLSRTKMSGAHVELYSYSFYWNFLLPLSRAGRLDPFTLVDYYPAKDLESVPFISGYFVDPDDFSLQLWSVHNKFRISVFGSLINSESELRRQLEGSLGFAPSGQGLSASVGAEGIEQSMLGIVRVLEAIRSG